MSEQMYQVRIKPYNKKRGFKVRCLFHRGKRYLEKAGWYSPIPKWLAEELAEVTQTDDPEKGVFDVVSIAEAKRIEATEKQEALAGQASYAQPFDASTVRGAPDPEPEPQPDGAHAEYESDEDSRPKPPEPEEEAKPSAKPKGRNSRRGAKVEAKK